MRLPDFYKKDTTVWFSLVERLLEGQSDEEKLPNLFQVLPTNVIMDTGIRTSDDFVTTKTAILKLYGDSQDQQLRKLLQEQQLGDRKPSAALRQMQQLAAESPKLVKLRFLELPYESVRVVLASLDEVSIDKLADLADPMLEQLPSITGIHKIDSVTTSN